MKLSEMDPATNALHKAFEETSLEFLRTEPWSEFPDVHFGFTFCRSGQQAEADERSDFCCGKYVKQKLQIFRDYGDLLQTERSNDVQIYAAPEGQVELEVRPERVTGSEEKQLRPRVNVYVPNMAALREGDGGKGYTKRAPTEGELRTLTLVARAGGELLKDLPSLAREKKDVPRPKGKPMLEELAAAAPKTDLLITYDPFERTYTVPDPSTGSDVEVTLRHPPVEPPAYRKCEFCSRRRAEMPRCAGCKVAYYCCPEHQKADWKHGHKKTCAQRAKMAVADEPVADVAGLPFLADLSSDAGGVSSGLRLPWGVPQGTKLEDFHAQGNDAAVARSPGIFTPDPEGFWQASRREDQAAAAAVELAAVPIPPAEPPSAPLASWQAAYGALSLPANSPLAVCLSDAMTLYHVLVAIQPHYVLAQGKTDFIVHIPDACLEPTVLQSFGLLQYLLPADAPRIKIVLTGRRLCKGFHYKAVSWGAARSNPSRKPAPPLTEGERTGKMGDLWRTREEDAVCVRFYCDDYASFLQKSQGDAGKCDLILLLNCTASRHGFFHSTSHACAQQLVHNKVPVVLSCYSKFEAERVVSSFGEVFAKEDVGAFDEQPKPPVLNPFRSPVKCATEMPVPSYANAYLTGWWR